MARQDDIAAKAVRKSTLTSLKVKKQARLRKLKKDYEEAVRNINIQYAKDPERLKAKYAAEDYAKSERAKKRAQKKIDAEKKVIEIDENKRQFTFAEELCSSIIQGFGVVFAIVSLVLFDTLAIMGIENLKGLSIVIYTFFGVSMILMYMTSVMHHALRNYTAREIFKRLSHCFCFVLIGWGYTAYALTKVQGVIGWVLFGIVWAIAVVGVVLFAVFGTKLDKPAMILYIVTGFSGIFVSVILHRILSEVSFRFLLTSAAFYIVALVFYSLRKVKFMHFIGNCIMLAGSVFLFLSLFYLNA